MRLGNHDIGVCSWSLQAKDMSDLLARMQRLDLRHLQLGLEPLLAISDDKRAEELNQLRHSGLVLTAGMISFPGEDYSSIAMIRQTGGLAPDDDWPARRRLALEAGVLARELGMSQVSTHVGFIPPSSHAGYGTMLKRVGEVAGGYAGMGLDLLMETGQETASELLQFLNDLGGRNVHVNFDPGNMVLYGVGEVPEAVAILGRHIAHVHIKDAKFSDAPGTHWGTEVAFGGGDVNASALLGALQRVEYAGPLMFECEIPGVDRVAAIGQGLEMLRQAIVGR